MKRFSIFWVIWEYQIGKQIPILGSMQSEEATGWNKKVDLINGQ